MDVVLGLMPIFVSPAYIPDGFPAVGTRWSDETAGAASRD